MKTFREHSGDPGASAPLSAAAGPPQPARQPWTAGSDPEHPAVDASSASHRSTWRWGGSGGLTGYRALPPMEAPCARPEDAAGQVREQWRYERGRRWGGGLLGHRALPISRVVDDDSGC